MSAACLAVDDLHSYYGESHILRGLSFTVPERRRCRAPWPQRCRQDDGIAFVDESRHATRGNGQAFEAMT